ncbi:FliA/WhiG family RNA polymerase sigma factor [Candidatus Nitrosoglobus terrae]|uniref:RNA polymerase sigma factor FliA n=1 Tax=Candidatus Nitrosoglobus terrae TaxID=1630141 RepID=A0A1Q2SK96_9GAMM|nr:RNA polymerase sigma factor FliA [Candidatus Nitrosoglobus terrae]BAW79544.1 FliA/WhiG family RNA polymerase sigma factor [Candidatus Nitrosoglobus terrae]
MNAVIAHYTAACTQKDIDNVIIEYTSLVKRIAYHVSIKLPPSVRLDDLIQAGMIGLLEAARNYDVSQGASFETYAGIRIRGAILDEIRRNDWAPRSVHRKARQVTEAIRKVENREGREARDHEVAKELGLSLDKYHRLLQDAGSYQVLSLDEFRENEDVNLPTTSLKDPSGILQNENFQSALVETIENLPERERLIMSLYYVEDLNLLEIGKVLGVSESRVSQIHGQAVLRLRARLRQWLS